MAKKGMKRPDPQHPGAESNRRTRKPKNEVTPVPEIKGKARSGKEHAGPM